VRAAGYATEHEEFRDGLCSIALPVGRTTGSPRHALALTAPIGRGAGLTVRTTLGSLRSAASELRLCLEMEEIAR
jgi:DNA-binding IclR family transcriptional regulator